MEERLAKQFGATIKKHRNKCGFSQEELAFEADMHRTYISLLERGLRQPSLNTIFQLAAALKCEPDQLVKETRKSYLK